MKIEVGEIYITRDHHKVRIICTDTNNTYPIVGLMTHNGKETVHTFTTEGKYQRQPISSDMDLVEKYSFWNNIEVDTPILVRKYENTSWEKAHFAKYTDDKVYVFSYGKTSWTTHPKYIISYPYAKLSGREKDAKG